MEAATSHLYMLRGFLFPDRTVKNLEKVGPGKFRSEGSVRPVIVTGSRGAAQA